MSLHGTLTPEQYKKSEKDFRFYSGLINKYGSVIAGFAISLVGFPEVPDEGLRHVKGRVSRLFRSDEMPFIEFHYLEYNEKDNIKFDPTLIKELGVKDLAVFLGAVTEHFKDVEMQAELGIIPSGIYCPVPFSLRLDKFDPTFIQINNEN